MRDYFSHKRGFDFEGFASLFYLPRVEFPLSPFVSLFNPHGPNSAVSFIEIGPVAGLTLHAVKGSCRLFWEAPTPLLFVSCFEIWQEERDQHRKVPRFSSVNFSSGIATTEMIENLLFPHSWRNCWKQKYWQHVKIVANYKYSEERDSRTTNAAARTDTALAVLGNCRSRWSSRSGTEERVQASLAITWWCSLPERHAGSSKLFPPPSPPHIIPHHVPQVTWNRVLLVHQTGCQLSWLILGLIPF